MTEENKELASQNAVADYDALVGKVVLVDTVDGYTEGDTSTTVYLDPPAVMRVSAYSTAEEIDSFVAERWMDDDRLDPTYQIELLEPHPDLQGIRGLWMYGQTYDGSGQPVEGIDFHVAPDDVQARYAPKTDPSSPWARP